MPLSTFLMLDTSAAFASFFITPIHPQNVHSLRPPTCPSSTKQLPVSNTLAQNITTRDARKLSIDVIPSPSQKATTLFIHDFMTDYRLFDPCFTNSPPTPLADYQLIRYDVPGFGTSEHPHEPYSRIEDIDDLLDSFDEHIPAIHLVGSGMGGAIALEYAIARSSRTLSLTCISSGLPGHRWSSEKLFIDITESLEIGNALAHDNEYIASNVSESAKDLVRWKKSFIGGSGTWTGALNAEDKAVGRMLLLMAKEYRGFHFFRKDPLLPEPCETEPLLKRLHQVACPVLVLVGEGDSVDFQKIAEEIHVGVQRSVCAPVKVAGATHFATLENPAVCVEEFVKFWKSL